MTYARQERSQRKLEAELDAAVLDGSRWKGVCDALAATLGGTGTLIVPVDPQRRGPWMIHSDAIGHGVQTYIREGWYKDDVRQAGWPIMRRRGFAVDHDFVDDDVIRKHPYYADFLAKEGISTFVGIHMPTGKDEWVASVQRSIGAGPAEGALLERVPRLRAMLVGAVRTAQAVDASGIENWRLHFGAAGRGFAMLDMRGRIIELNAAAEALLAPFLRLRGRLAFPETPAGRQAAELIARATEPVLRLPLPPTVLLPMGSRALVIEAMPAPTALRDFHVDPAAILVVRLAEAPVLDRSLLLSRALGLTASEARLAERIGEGQSLREAAEAEAVTYETARTRLKAIFAKTGCSRQAELVLVVSRLAASLDAGAIGNTRQ